MYKTAKNLVNKSSVASKSFLDVLPWFIPWTVKNARNDKLNQQQFFKFNLIFPFKDKHDDIPQESINRMSSRP